MSISTMDGVGAADGVCGVMALLCVVLMCSACDSRPVVECGEQAGLVGGGFWGPREPWVPSERPRSEWRVHDFHALVEIVQIDEVEEGFYAEEPERDPDVVEAAAAMLLSHAIEGDEAPRSIAEVISVCEQAVEGLTAHELLEGALDVCENGFRGMPLLGCPTRVFRRALE